jgi:hypothetical protein
MLVNLNDLFVRQLTVEIRVRRTRGVITVASHAAPVRGDGCHGQQKAAAHCRKIVQLSWVQQFSQSLSHEWPDLNIRDCELGDEWLNGSRADSYQRSNHQFTRVRVWIAQSAQERTDCTCARKTTQNLDAAVPNGTVRISE